VFKIMQADPAQVKVSQGDVVRDAKAMVIGGYHSSQYSKSPVDPSFGVIDDVMCKYVNALMVFVSASSMAAHIAATFCPAEELLLIQPKNSLFCPPGPALIGSTTGVLGTWVCWPSLGSNNKLLR
jgi:hypothetical protein